MSEKVKIGEAGVCPKCGEQEFMEYDASEVDGDVLSYPFSCSNCGFAGYETYDISFSCMLDELGRPIREE